VRLISRYLLRQLAAPFLFGLAALTSLMLLSQVAKKFGALVGKGLPWGVIGEVFALSLPFIVAMTLPMAVLLAVLYAFSHLAADNEITALRASGISVYQILAPVLAWGVVMSVLNFAFVDQVLPRTNARLRGLLIDIGRKKPTLELREQVINEVPPSQYFLRAGRIDAATGRLKDITIYDMGGETNRRIIYADSGRMAYNEGRTDLNLRLFDGSIHQYRPSDPLTFQLTYYRVNDIRVKDVYDELVRNSSETVRGDREMSTCEMLTVMQDARRDLRNADRDRQTLLISDLRTLLHLPPLAPAPADNAPGRLPAYCGWIERVQTALTKTAEPPRSAQPPAPGARVARQGASIPPTVPAPAPANRERAPARQVADTPVVPLSGTAVTRPGRTPSGDQLDAVRRRAARMGTGSAAPEGLSGTPLPAAPPGKTLGGKPLGPNPLPSTTLPGQRPANQPRQAVTPTQLPGTTVPKPALTSRSRSSSRRVSTSWSQ
jgi:lipopolysaccharide export system permease protein